MASPSSRPTSISKWSLPHNPAAREVRQSPDTWMSNRGVTTGLQGAGVRGAITSPSSHCLAASWSRSRPWSAGPTLDMG